MPPAQDTEISKTTSQCHYTDALTEGKYNTIQEGKDPGLRDNHVHGPDRA